MVVAVGQVVGQVVGQGAVVMVVMVVGRLSVRAAGYWADEVLGGSVSAVEEAGGNEGG